jgi:hypothetical protein
MKNKEEKPMKYIFFTVLLVLSATTFAFSQNDKEKQAAKTVADSEVKPPTGWGKSGSDPGNYEIFADTNIRRSGKASATIKAKPTAVKDQFTTMMQSIRADNFRGKRVRLSGYIKTENVGNYAGMWMRVDGADMKMLDFDNMTDRPIKGTTDWKRYEVVLDVGSDAQQIAFGVNLGESGQVWADDLKVEIVGPDTAKTTLKISPEEQKNNEKELEEFKRTNKEKHETMLAKIKTRPLTPVNLDFEN